MEKALGAVLGLGTVYRMLHRAGYHWRAQNRRMADFSRRFPSDRYHVTGGQISPWSTISGS